MNKMTCYTCAINMMHILKWKYLMRNSEDMKYVESADEKMSKAFINFLM